MSARSSARISSSVTTFSITEGRCAPRGMRLPYPASAVGGVMARTTSQRRTHAPCQRGVGALGQGGASGGSG
jgi:hypothetical protein